MTSVNAQTCELPVTRTVGSKLKTHKTNKGVFEIDCVISFRTTIGIVGGRLFIERSAWSYR
ncbi:MAG: hypothetical protein ABI691_00920 [Ginsengibacter sp.]